MEHVRFDIWMRGRVELVAVGLLAALLGRASALVGGGEEGLEAVPETREDVRQHEDMPELLVLGASAGLDLSGRFGEHLLPVDLTGEILAASSLGGHVG